jgi:glycine cleavage system aminomethyltransferase T
MDPDRTLARDVDALLAGRAYVVEGAGAVDVAGADAIRWLHDLLAADVASLRPGEARRSLLLTPTGRIRADVVVVRTPSGATLLQPSDQPDRAGDLLARYVLSSDVELGPERAVRVVRCPGAPVDVTGLDGGPIPAAPSSLGGGLDLVAPDDAALEGARRAAGRDGRIEVGTTAADAARVVLGDARLGVDVEPGDLPGGTPLDRTIASAKGCFLGQESVARVRNLGHPPIAVRGARVDGPAAPGDEVLVDGAPPGRVTSVALDPEGGTALIVRVPWAAADRAWRLRDGREVRPRA